jgi:hypothetical protein
LLLTIDPGWPWDEPLKVRIQASDRHILDEWNIATLNSLDGKSVRCIIIEGGFVISDTMSGTGRTTIQWDDVRAVRAFKRDLFAYDMICLAFQLPDKSWVEICERSEGFVAVMEEMGRILPGISENWYYEIMIPAFATMDTLLYRQDDEHGHWLNCPNCGYNLTGNVTSVCPECGKRI